MYGNANHHSKQGSLRSSLSSSSTAVNRDPGPLKVIKIYFPGQSVPFTIPYLLTEARGIGNQLKDQIDSIASGMQIAGGANDWLLISAHPSPDSAGIEMFHKSSLVIVADTFIKPDGDYLLLWTTDSWNAEELVKKGLRRISK